MKNIDKLDIADEYFELALECFLDKKRYASAIHLAGAAQELYGKWIRVNGGKEFNAHILDTAEEVAVDSGMDFNRKDVNKTERTPKNALKHMNNKEDRFTQINLELEAMSILGETMIDHAMAGRQSSDLIERFKVEFKRIMLLGSF